MSLLKRLQVSLLRILCGVPIVSLLVLGVLFAFFSVTWKGRCVGLSAVLFGRPDTTWSAESTTARTTT